MKKLTKNIKSFNRCKQMRKKENGITLIALAVTIIVLIILAGISITSLTGEKGIINQARTNSENAQKESIIEKIEADLLKEKTKTGNTPSKDKLKEIIQENEYNDGALGEDSFVTKDGGYTINYDEIDGWENLLSNIAKPGDYVSYKPDIVNNKTIDELITDLNMYSGTSDNNSSTLKQENLNWRVLDIQEEKVRLICENPTISTISLYGAKGYNNAVYLIDKVCEELYSNSKVSTKVQNLKIEDIEKKLTYDYTSFSNKYVDTGKYGGFSITPYTLNTKYPTIYSQERNNGVGGSKNNGVLSLSEQPSPINEETSNCSSLGVTQTYWYKTMNDEDFAEKIYFELFIKKDNNYNTYWLSSRCVYADEVNAIFYTDFIYQGDVSAQYLYNSYNDSYLHSYAFRPIVSLNSNIITEQGDGKSPETAYEISI